MVSHETARRYLNYSGTTNDGSYYVRKIGIDKSEAGLQRCRALVSGLTRDRELQRGFKTDASGAINPASDC